MKTKITFFGIALLINGLIFSQVNAGQIDDFQNGTTQNWTDGGSSVPPVNNSNGGPNGAGDNYLSDPSLGGGGPGSKMVMFNDQQWAGNYISTGIVTIRFHAKAQGNTLNLRVAFDGAGGRICTTNAVLIPANGSWQQYVISITAGDFTTVAGGTNIGQTLADVSDMRILSNTVASWQGESIVATLDIDNIEASTTLGIEDFANKIAFKIVPNPNRNYLNISLNPALTANTEVTVFDIFGKLVMNKTLSGSNTSIPVMQWQDGIYFVRVSVESSSQVLKFIKI